MKPLSVRISIENLGWFGIDPFAAQVNLALQLIILFLFIVSMGLKRRVLQARLD